eukprot:253174-Karenia_brevis.AAC.1
MDEPYRTLVLPWPSALGPWYCPWPGPWYCPGLGPGPWPIMGLFGVHASIFLRRSRAAQAGAKAAHIHPCKNL